MLDERCRSVSEKCAQNHAMKMATRRRSRSIQVPVCIKPNYGHVSVVSLIEIGHACSFSAARASNSYDVLGKLLAKAIKGFDKIGCNCFERKDAFSSVHLTVVGHTDFDKWLQAKQFPLRGELLRLLELGSRSLAIRDLGTTRTRS